MTVIKTEINASLTIGKGTWAAATHTEDRNPIPDHLYCWVSTVRMALGLHRLPGEDLGLTGELIKKP